MGDIICLDPNSTDVATEFTLLPLSFKPSIMVYISFWGMGYKKKLGSTLFFKKELVVFGVEGILDIKSWMLVV